MITRLKIDGFKNLVNVDVRFGPFTCIAGLNAVGKSNLFDAIRFLSCLADKTLLDSARSVRSEVQKNTDIGSLFNRVGKLKKYYSDRMTFEVEMLIPEKSVDELGQSAVATITTVKYTLALGLKKENIISNNGLIEILKEELLPITLREAERSIGFEVKKEWIKSVIKGRRSTNSPFISTVESAHGTIIRLHQDQLKGRPLDREAKQLPKTVLSTVDATQNPTALIVKNEMLSWQLLQLEPNALRQSDEFYTISNAKLGQDGSNLPATLYRLKLESDINKEKPNIYKLLSNRLSELIDGVSDIEIDKDDKRELLTLIIKDKNGTPHSSRSLSDGTLRFIGLAVLELDQKSSGVICLEEPENGIHPEKIKSVLKLLQDISTDTSRCIDTDNPLRQVIVNTHSSLVVQQVADDSLLMAELKEDINDKKIRFQKVIFSPLSNTWRTTMDKNLRPVSLGNLLSYLSATDDNGYKTPCNYMADTKKQHYSHKKRVIDREDIRQLKINFTE